MAPAHTIVELALKLVTTVFIGTSLAISFAGLAQSTEDVPSAFARNGYAVVKGFASSQEVGGTTFSCRCNVTE